MLEPLGLSAVSAGEEVVPTSELNEALKQIKELQWLLGKDHGKRNSSGSRGDDEVAKMDSALALIAGARPVKEVCEGLSVAHSNVAAKLARGCYELMNRYEIDSWHERQKALSERREG